MAFSDKYYVNLTVNGNTLNFHVQIKEEISNPVVRSEIYVQSSVNDSYNVEVMNRTIDACTFFSNKLHEPLMQIIFQIVQSYGSIPHSCPVKMVFSIF